MKTYSGGCHCGAVRFEVVTRLDKLMECNCSICAKKGALHHRVPPERFTLIAGQDALALYQFGSNKAKHWFCRRCGIQPFTNPRSAPEIYSINVRCLDDADSDIAGIEVQKFDGKNWERAVEALKSSPR